MISRVPLGSGLRVVRCRVPHLRTTLRTDPAGLRVAWRLSGVELGEGDVVGQLPPTIAGAPTIDLGDGELVAVDDGGPVALTASVEEDEEDGRVRRWRPDRATTSTTGEPVPGCWSIRPRGEMTSNDAAYDA